MERRRRSLSVAHSARMLNVAVEGLCVRRIIPQKGYNLTRAPASRVNRHMNANIEITEALRLYARAIASFARNPLLRDAAAKWERRLNRTVIKQSVLSTRPLGNLRQLRE